MREFADNHELAQEYQKQYEYFWKTLSHLEKADRSAPFLTSKDNLLYGSISQAAIDAFGDAFSADSWLQENNMALEGKAPIDLLGTPEGVERVRNVLRRIRDGLFT
jgi:Protein of unknown function (DUF2384)